MVYSNSENNELGVEEQELRAWQIEQIRLTRGMNEEDIQQLPEAVLRRALRRLEYPDAARERAAFRGLTETSAHDIIPAHALANALQQLQDLRAHQTNPGSIALIPSGSQVIPESLGHRRLAPTAGLTKRSWLSLGPGNIGGRTRSMIIHPTEPQTIWVGSVGGGVWRTDDGGDSWNPVDDFMANLAVCCLVMDPNNPNIIYAGTGEGFFGADNLRGAGIFRTVDGVTWQQLASTKGEEFQWLNRLAISPDGRILLAVGTTGIFRSEDPERNTWIRTLPGDIADIDFHPRDNNQAIAGSRDNGRAYYSQDGGLTWQIATATEIWGSGRVEVTYAVANPKVVYASLQRNQGEIWRSTDGGKTYSKRGGRDRANSRPASYLGDQGWYDNVIWAGDPTNENFVLVGGIDLWKSEDGGNNLQPISTWWASPESAHADHHCIVAHPQFDSRTNKAVFFGNDGGVYTTEDVYSVGYPPHTDDSGSPIYKRGWRELNNGYGVTQFYAGAANATTGVIIGGTQDNGTLRYEGDAESWTEMFGGDGGWCAADPQDNRYFYGEYVYLNIHRSSDGGQKSEYISGQYWDGRRWAWKNPPYRIEDAYNSQALFIAPFVLDSNNPQRILAGGISLWRTNDARTPNTNSTGPRWQKIKSSDGRGIPISAIAVARGNDNLIWVGHSDGAIFKTLNGTSPIPSWQKINRSVPEQNRLSVDRFCTQISIDALDHNIVYITYGGYSRGNVWKTTDGGSNWQNIGDSLPEAPVRAMTIHPQNSDFVYLGTEVGVFSSENGGLTWSPTNEGPTNCSVDDLFWMGTTLIAATHGRGMFKIDLSLSS